MNRTYKLKTDRTDPRDHIFSRRGIIIAPESDLSAGFCPHLDQLTLGSCMGNAFAEALSFIHGKQVASRLMIYYGARDLEGTVNKDAGAEIRDGAKFLAQVGACPEPMWPYIIKRFKDRPSQACYDAAGAFKISSYQRLTGGANDIMACLSSGFPVVAGIAVYASFESAAVAASGIVPMPAPGEELLGFHAIIIEGHNRARGKWKCRNSWGLWGMQGDFELPFEYAEKPGLMDDLWTVRK